MSGVKGVGLGRKLSQEHKAKISAGLTKFYADPVKKARWYDAWLAAKIEQIDRPPEAACPPSDTTLLHILLARVAALEVAMLTPRKAAAPSKDSWWRRLIGDLSGK